MLSHRPFSDLHTYLSTYMANLVGQIIQCTTLREVTDNMNRAALRNMLKRGKTEVIKFLEGQQVTLHSMLILGHLGHGLYT